LGWICVFKFQKTCGAFQSNLNAFLLNYQQYNANIAANHFFNFQMRFSCCEAATNLVRSSDFSLYKGKQHSRLIHNMGSFPSFLP